MTASREVIYVAGPYSAPTLAGVFSNVQAAIAFGQQVRTLGLVPLVPHTAILPTGTTDGEYEAALAECFELLSRCDAVVLMPTWVDSPGARREREHAERLGLTVFEDIGMLAEVSDAVG